MPMPDSEPSKTRLAIDMLRRFGPDPQKWDLGELMHQEAVHSPQPGDIELEPPSPQLPQAPDLQEIMPNNLQNPGGWWANAIRGDNTLPGKQLGGKVLEGLLDARNVKGR